jgi:hypothetical protein
MSYLARFLNSGGFLQEPTDQTDETPLMSRDVSVSSVPPTTNTQRSPITVALWPPRPPELSGWPVERRERWGRLANDLEAQGTPFPDSEVEAFRRVKADMQQHGTIRLARPKPDGKQLPPQG